jgi:hypothetical protein
MLNQLRYLPLIAPAPMAAIGMWLFLIAALPMPSVYYMFMRVFVTLLFIILAIRAKREGIPALYWLMVSLAILFNPLFAITLPRPVWIPIDLMLAFACWKVKFSPVSRI